MSVSNLYMLLMLAKEPCEPNEMIIGITLSWRNSIDTKRTVVAMGETDCI